MYLYNVHQQGRGSELIESLVISYACRCRNKEGHRQALKASISIWDNIVNDPLKNGMSRFENCAFNPIRGGGQDDALVPFDGCCLQLVC